MRQYLFTGRERVFKPNLTSLEGITLLRDTITRLKNADLLIRDIKGELYIEER